MGLIAQVQNLNGPLCAALAFENREDELAQELGPEFVKFGRLFIALQSRVVKKTPLIWAQDFWPDTKLLPCPSITQGAAQLKKISSLWALYSVENHRRAQLIQEKLKSWNFSAVDFMQKIEKKHFGAWTLLEKEWMLACAKTAGQTPLGEIQFIEDRKFPPTRAYLKLWELFTLHLNPPKKSDTVIDLGSCPGGWTWVLQSLGCKVISVDKAPLDPKIAKLARIEFMKKDAFALKPEDVPPLDWLFSDIICTPEKLFELVQKWRASGRVKNFVCTIKFKGKTDFVALQRFKDISGSVILHLNHNKHEATWILTEKTSS